MKYLSILSKIWLGQNESKIYISLLRLWEMSISEISKKTGLHRPVVYALIPYLQELGLISQKVVGKRKFYLAESPENLMNIFEETKNNFETVIEEFTEMFEENKQSKPILKSIEGENFAKYVFDDIGQTLGQNGVYYRYSSVRSLEWQDKFAHYKKLRNEKNIQRQIITSDWLSKTKPKSMSHEVASIPKNYDLFDDDVTRVIYANKVWVIDHANKVSFIIENWKLANFERKLFKLLFRFLKK